MLVGRTAIKAQRLRPGESAGFDVLADQFVQVIALHGTQAASLVAFSKADPAEKLAVSQTRGTDLTLFVQRGMSLYSNRQNSLLELAEDSVGRHDLLMPLDPDVAFGKGEAASPAAGSLAAELSRFGVAADALPDPFNIFMHVGFGDRGKLEIRESLAEKSDSVLLRAVVDCVVGIVALPAKFGGGEAGAEPEIMVRVFQ
jgi:uncharacterized protein YcgI (DUF1989 family)